MAVWCTVWERTGSNQPVLSQPVHQTATYSCDDIRGCVMQFWPPDDEHMCSKHVEAWNKLIVKQKFCSSSWLITEINILTCTVSKTSKFKVLLVSLLLPLTPFFAHLFYRPKNSPFTKLHDFCLKEGGSKCTRKLVIHLAAYVVP